MQLEPDSALLYGLQFIPQIFWHCVVTTDYMQISQSYFACT